MKKWQLAAVGAVALIVVAAVAGVFILGKSGSAATVNGVGIPKSDVERELANYRKQQPAIFSGPNGKEQEKQARGQALDMLINAELIRQEAEKAGVKVTAQQVDARMAQIKKMFPDPAKYKQALKDQGLTEAALRERFESQLLAEKMLVQASGAKTISDKEVKAFYEKNKAQMMEPEKKRWRQILVKDKAKADDLLSQLKDGADFEKLAKANSIDEATKNNGGDLGLRQEADFPPEIATALKKVPPKANELSEVIKSQDGYHIYELSEIKPAQQKTLDEVKGQIKQFLTRQKGIAWLDKVRKKAKIVKTPED